MNSIEEKLWDYIDGQGTAANREAIAQLIQHDEVYRSKYHELLALNAEFAAIETDEPPMAFTYNVMEQIRIAEARVPLKSALNTRIIKGIAGFFIVSIVALVIFALTMVKWQTGGGQWQMPDFTAVIPSNAFKAFMFFDVILGLYIFDAWLRRKKAAGAV